MKAADNLRGGPFGKVDFDRAPFLVIWETTRSCALACRHCRADAILRRDPRELSTEEGKSLLDEVAAMGTPIVVLSGGDPLNREDLEELIRHGKDLGLRMATIPAATEGLTQRRVHGLKDAGLDQIAFSLDGPAAGLHDSFRGVPGAFARTLRAVGWAHEAGLPLQINTCFAAWNFQYLEKMVDLVRGLEVVFWEVFFLIPMGRGSALAGLSTEQFEAVFERLHRLNSEEEFIVKLTEAPQYRRFVIRKELGSGNGPEESRRRIGHALARPRGVGGSLGMSPQAVNSGKGFLFVDHTGDVCPSGFLPIPAGSVRRSPLADIYRHSPLFLELREPGLLTGRCGACEFKAVCGGSRARAWATSGDYLAADPACQYVPAERSAPS